MKNKLKEKLSNYSYNFTEKGNDKLIIDLNYGLICEIIFLDNNSMNIKGYLKAWNFLTGTIKVKINQLVIYNSIWLSFLLFIQLFYRTDNFKLPYIPFIILAWFIMWNLHYIIVFYSFKSILINLNNNK